MQKFLKFPEGFWWGSATSSHQVEGNTHNNWSEWEQSPARTSQLKKQGKNPKDFISGRACDNYNRYPEDFNIAKQLGHTMYRLSIEWARIEPEEGKFDEKELQHYRDVIDALRVRGIEPMVTLFHWTQPLWFAKKGGFLHPDAPQAYKRFISKAVDNLKDRVGVWITFNEATTVFAGMSYLRGEWPPQHKNLWHWYTIRRAIIKSHQLAYQEIKKIYSSSDVSRSNTGSPSMSHNVGEVKVGIVENNRHFIAPWWLRALGIERLVRYLMYDLVWNQVLPFSDFIGLNYYTIGRFPGSSGMLSRQGTDEMLGWEIYPQGLYHLLMKLRRYGKPVIVTENGLADRHDQKRTRYIREHLRWVWQAIQDGVDVQGYLHWSLIDNFEWARGFGPRFGLVEVNYETLERKIRPSAREYGKIIQDNGFSADI